MNNTEQSYGWLAISLHWLTAILVFGLFGLGLWMVELGYYHAWYQKAPNLHKGLGVFLFALMSFRLIWRLLQIQPKALATHQKWEQIAAHATHWLLYLLLFVIMFSGYLISTADGRGLSVFGWFSIPSLGQLFNNQEYLAGLMHQYAAYVLMALVLLHVCAALKHHLIDKDKTLKRMLGKTK